LKITILGSGTSQGVPVIACNCNVCTSKNPKDNRLRSSILISYKGNNYVVDSGPDFRQQMLREQVKTLSGVLFTHEHKDHLAGLDDVRAFNFKEQRDMQVYCTSRVEEALRREYAYVFTVKRYPGIPAINLNRIDKETNIELEDGLTIIPIEVMHYRLPVLGFRIGDFTYITDAKTVTEEERLKIRGTKVLIINALRKEEHISHFNLEEALAFIKDIQPETAYITHISHLFGTHEEISDFLPENVFVAYDGFSLEIDL
jgi:phosphoribosyl 1,2-cyclic phosphate phosphodiesterase